VAKRRFLTVGDDRVTMLDRERRPIRSDLNFTLVAQPVGLANPASVNCVWQGGVLRVVQEAQGWRGVCRFPDGRNCDEWDLLRQGSCG
jgi:putative hemolysin